LRDGVGDGTFFGGLGLPFVRDARLLAYYRFAYDSIYDLAPGTFLRGADGGIGGKIGDLRGRSRSDAALENVLRELYLDVDLAVVPVTVRIGRSQVVWGNTLVFRTLDTVTRSI
jgi:hypothetical protein